MFFSVKHGMNFQQKDLIKKMVKTHAYRDVISYKITYKDILLTEYIFKTYKKTLKEMCVWLIKNSTITVQEEDVLITFTGNADKIAKFITYGNGRIRGCKILTQAFGKS